MLKLSRSSAVCPAKSQSASEVLQISEGFAMEETIFTPSGFVQLK
jgi:hypothetical protein